MVTMEAWMQPRGMWDRRSAAAVSEVKAKRGFIEWLHFCAWEKAPCYRHRACRTAFPGTAFSLISTTIIPFVRDPRREDASFHAAWPESRPRMVKMGRRRATPTLVCTNIQL